MKLPLRHNEFMSKWCTKTERTVQVTAVLRNLLAQQQADVSFDKSECIAEGASALKSNIFAIVYDLNELLHAPHAPPRCTGHENTAH